MPEPLITLSKKEGSRQNSRFMGSDIEECLESSKSSGEATVAREEWVREREAGDRGGGAEGIE